MTLYVFVAEMLFRVFIHDGIGIRRWAPFYYIDFKSREWDIGDSGPVEFQQTDDPADL